MPEEKLNIHQKLLKIADMAGVLRKNKDGFNYKYVTEDEIQAKITADWHFSFPVFYRHISRIVANT